MIFLFTNDCTMKAAIYRKKHILVNMLQQLKQFQNL